MRTSFLLIAVMLFFSAASHAQSNSLNFDGINDYVSTASRIVPASGDFTVEFWTNVASTLLSNRNFLSQGSLGSAFYIGTDILGNFRCGDNWTSPGVAMPLNQWTHIAFVKSGSAAYLYMDGILKATKASGYSISAAGANLQIGAKYTGSSEYVSARMDELRIWNVARTATQIKFGMYGTIATNASGLVAYYKMDEGGGTTLGNSTATAGLDGTLTNGTAWSASPPISSQNSLNFDGVNDQVLASPSANYDISTGTIECWVRPGVLIGNACVLANRGAGGSRYSIHMSTSAVGLWNNSVYGSVAFNSSVGQWYHLAFVCSGGNTNVYIDGTYIGQTGNVFSSITGQPFAIGIAKNLLSDGEPFTGSIDEVRIWNTARTQLQIQNYKDIALTGTETGLVALFNFNHGISGGLNTGLITALDQTPNNNHGTLFNFALTGSTSNWVSHSMISLPVRLSTFTVSKTGKNALIKWQTEEEWNTKEFLIERSSTGANFNVIGSVAAAGNSAIKRNYQFIDASPLAGINYYRIRQVDNDGHFVYTMIKSVSFTAPKKISWFAAGSGTLNIKWENGTNENYTVRDMNGRIAKEGSIVNGTVKLYHLMPGMYTITVNTKGVEVTTLAVVQ